MTTKNISCLFICFLLSFVLGVQVQAQESTTSADRPFIKFEETEYDFGEIKQGESVTRIFKFENTGAYPLVISQVRTTCGCTAPTWPREPIAPGEKSEITIVFNSRGKMGKQRKTITVISNAENSDAKLVLSGNIVMPEPQNGSNE
ncbi:MAG: DUF1573 domain-containing protein [Bernardetiaceae bacterium]|nr:DUF1573 domain-containing protein [Bernardetiaceae bacterium]